MLWYSLEGPHQGFSNEYSRLCQEIRKILIISVEESTLSGSIDLYNISIAIDRIDFVGIRSL